MKAKQLDPIEVLTRLSTLLFDDWRDVEARLAGHVLYRARVYLESPRKHALYRSLGPSAVDALYEKLDSNQSQSQPA